VNPSPATITATTVTVNGVRSPILTAGEQSSSEAVVFVHGNPGPADDWTSLMGRTGEFARSVAPDMPGYGKADKPKDLPYTVHGYARHLAGILDQLGITRAHLVLHDFGGPWGLQWAVDHPDAVASVTLINTGVLLDYTWHRFAKIWRTPVLGDVFTAITTGTAMKALVARENPRLLPSQLDRLWAVSKPWPTRRAVLKLYRATPATAMGSLRDPLRALNLPALVVFGVGDAYIPWPQAERQRESFPSARVELLDGLGHWPFLEDPGRVAEVVIPFLLEQVTEGAGLDEAPEPS
jgi:pimeloyl-ACP methyl ester carboxylesterase